MVDFDHAVPIDGYLLAFQSFQSVCAEGLVGIGLSLFVVGVAAVSQGRMSRW
jgi:hypothetical protein